MSTFLLTVRDAVSALHRGGLIAYPTEAVFGLGCDPNHQQAVLRLLHLKQRSVAKGLIVVASDWQQVADWCLPLSDVVQKRVFATWPGPCTWLLPACVNAPCWITGQHAGIAVRISAHPVVRALCDGFGGAIVSTSANRSGTQPLREARAVKQQFGVALAGLVEGALGALQQPTSIRDGITGEWIRRESDRI